MFMQEWGTIISSLVCFILCCYGMTQILVYGSIFKNHRPASASWAGLGEIFHCPMCMGFWVGLFVASLNPFTGLFTFDVSLVSTFLLGCLSSGTSYALCVLISDGGFQHEYRIKRNVDAKMDAKTSNQLLQG